MHKTESNHDLNFTFRNKLFERRKISTKIPKEEKTTIQAGAVPVMHPERGRLNRLNEMATHVYSSS